MFCTSCGKSVPDSTTFCPYCGTPLSAAPPAQTPATPVEPAVPVMATPVTTEPEAPVVSETPAAPVNPVVPVAPTSPTEGIPNSPEAYPLPFANAVPAVSPVAVKKKLNPLIIILPIIAVVLAAAVLVGMFVVLPLFAKSPLTGLAEAFAKTGTVSSLNVDVLMNLSESGSSTSLNGNGVVVLDKDNNDLTADFSIGLPTMGDVRYAIYKKNMLMDFGGYTQKQDISEALAAFFEASNLSTEDIADGDYEALVKKLFTTLGDEVQFDRIKEEIDFTQLALCLKALDSKTNDTNWLETYLGMKISTQNGEKVFAFTPDLGALLTELKTIFTPAFKHPEELDLPEEALSDLKDFSLSFAYRVKNGYVSGMVFAMTGSSDSNTIDVNLNMSLSQFNTAKVDTASLDSLLAGATDSGSYGGYNQFDSYDDYGDYYGDYGDYGDYYGDYADYYSDYADYYGDYADYYGDYAADAVA